jgi:hypothetical protein
LQLISSMFVNEFMFSFSLLAFMLGLLVLGVVILGDGVRRLVLEWRSKPASQKDSGVVLVVDIRRPVSNSVRNRPHNLIERPLAMPEKKVS